MKTVFLTFALAAMAVAFVGCASNEANTPPRPSDNLSSMPHNMPAAWEGQQGLPGMPGGGGY
ncbi:MAG: hypothetical protein AAF226_09620 [Verrucomicrobiota bacterium]